MATLLICSALAALLGAGLTWLICRYLEGGAAGIAERLAGVVHSTIDTRRAQRDYESSKRRLEHESRVLVSQLEALKARKAEADKTYREAMKREGETRLPYAAATEEIVKAREAPPLPPKATLKKRYDACLADLERHKTYFEASQTRIRALVAELQTGRKVIELSESKVTNLTRLLAVQTNLTELSEARVKELRKRKVRWGPGFAVGVDARNGQISPSYSVGIAVIWGR